MHIPSALLVVDNYLKETPKFGIETAAKGGNGVVNGEIVDKTRSFLTGTESKAEERQRPAREETERDIGENSEDGRTKGERDEGKKKSTRAPPAGLDETHACDPIPMAYRVSMLIRLSSRTLFSFALSHLLDLFYSATFFLNFFFILFFHAFFRSFFPFSFHLSFLYIFL